ncbi:hypothetical protein VFPPC_17703 [Pochonia chlamydosporia 170]|uniref:Uncharacterized protein n=1 Tax=Pochonia chlamydosporia 170 TaxID=1380566 RepID=A0A219AQT4_METCM|nr:hypothetical protein VFPPC_17703 [Pochonia chlamydosporia 170]OWT43121.1 hypothetical protein VFPPC_17703 [Pochonia chlamydosporia 170]
MPSSVDKTRGLSWSAEVRRMSTSTGHWSPVPRLNTSAVRCFDSVSGLLGEVMRWCSHRIEVDDMPYTDNRNQIPMKGDAVIWATATGAISMVVVVVVVVSSAISYGCRRPG